MYENEMNDYNNYVRFLENAVESEIKPVDVPSVYKTMASPIRDWDGTGSLPTISKEEDLDEVINKILKKTPDNEGTDDPLRDEGGPVGSVMESADNDDDDDDDDILDDDDDDDDILDDDDKEGCDGCDKKIEELYYELGLSPMYFLEDDDGDDDDDDDDDDDEDDDEDDDGGDNHKPGFTANESRILEALIREMAEDEDEDDDDEDEDDDDDDDDDED
jgi:hypothetical protein